MILTLTEDEFLTILATVERAVIQKAKQAEGQNEVTIACRAIGDMEGVRSSVKTELMLHQEFADLQAVAEILRSAEYQQEK